MNNLQVRTQETLWSHGCDIALLTTRFTQTPIAVHCDRQLRLPSSLPFTAVDVGVGPEWPPESYANRNPIICFPCRPLRAKAIEVVKIHEPIATEIIGAAIREAATHAHINLSP